MTKGVSWLKYQLARVSRHNVGICSVSTPKIMQATHNPFYAKDKKKEGAVAIKVELGNGGVA